MTKTLGLKHIRKNEKMGTKRMIPGRDKQNKILTKI